MPKNDEICRRKNPYKAHYWLFLVFCILLVTPIISADLHFDNVKEDLIINASTSEYGRINVKDWFGLFDLATLELEKNTDMCGVDCSAETKIIMHQKGALVDSVRFMEKRDDGTYFESEIDSYQFYIKTGERETGNMIDDYEYQCDAITTFNLTKGTKCDWVKIGEHAETEPLWIKYHLGDEVEIGEYVIKLEGQKNYYKTVDWQITSQGKLIDEWADWGSGGTISYDGNYTVHTFRVDGTFETETDGLVTVLLVAGGGSGGDTSGTGGGGGGAGGVILNSTYILPAGSYPVVIGQGGVAPVADNQGGNGTNTTFGNLEAVGGGGGGSESAQGNNGISGGSSGGGSGAGASGSEAPWDGGSQGNIGGVGEPSRGVSGAGGGGASSAGENPDAGVPDQGGNGGNGTVYTINGSSVAWGGGGGGGAHAATRNGGIGGTGGGGTGGSSASSPWVVNGAAGLDGYGGGGGGSGEGGVPGDGGNGIFIIRYPSNYTFASDVNVFLNEPADNLQSTTGLLDFNCTANISTGGLSNMSLWFNITGTWILNETEDVSGLRNTTTWTKNIPEGSNFGWTCQAFSNVTISGWGTNRTMTIDSVFPQITINLPEEDSNYFESGKSETLNWSIVESNLGSIWFSYNGTNTTLYGLNNETTFIVAQSPFNLTLYVNDTVGNFNSSFREWEYKIFLVNETFNAETTEGATEPFTLTLTKSASAQVSTIDLIYNGTVNSFAYATVGNTITAQGSIVIPAKDIESNVSFYYNIKLADGSAFNTTANNQTISIINMDNCTSYTNVIYNFTQYDEQTKVALTSNNTMEVQVNLYDTSKTINLINYSEKFFGINPTTICLQDALLTTVNYSSYVVVKYYANATGSSNAYATEYYNILNQTISNTTVPNHISLYDLNSKDATKFRLTFRDSAYVLAPNVLVQIHRQYVEDNDFKIVEIPLTDSNGQTILNLVRNTVVYNFIMVDEAGDVIATFNSVKAFCQDFTIGECTIILSAPSIAAEAYDYNDEFGISIIPPTYDNSTELVSLSFVTDDLKPKEVSMYVLRNNDFGNRSVCSNSLTTSSGSLSCDVSGIVATDQFLFIHVYTNGNLSNQYTINLNASTLSFGILNGAFYAFMIVLFLICLFMDDKKAILISIGLGWVIVISLGLMNGKLIGASSAGIWLLVSIAIFMYKLNKEGAT